MVGHTPTMHITRSQGHHPSGSDENVLNVFTIFGCGGHLGHVTKNNLFKVWLSYHKESPYEF